MNPAREVKTERFSRTEGKTPAFVEGEVQKLLGAIETSTHTGLRDRALLGVLAYTFARIGAVVNLKVEDYYPSGKRFLLRFKEKGGKEKELPVHHKLEELREHFIFACVSMRHNRLFDPFMAPEEAYHETLSRISLFATEKKSRDIIVLLLE